jgi:hypothetical protein
MTRPLFIAAVLLALALALVACGGGGTNNGDGVWEYVATVCANGGCPTPAPWELPTATPNGRPTADATATPETLICPPPVDGHRVLCLIAPEATAAALATAAADGMATSATQEAQP